jgi:gliding motility-associated-like protein
MKRLLPFIILLLVSTWTFGQCAGSCPATTFTVDLSSVTDTVVTIQSTRNGNCCSGSNCIRFNITVSPGTNYVNFSVASPAPNGSAHYQINCGPQTSLGTPACITGLTSFCIAYCKPGGDNPTYTITASSTIRSSDDLKIRVGCTGEMGVNGLLPGSVVWNSIFPGSEGAYNSFLSCQSGCAQTSITPEPGAPAYIDYRASGLKACGGSADDTIRVYIYPELKVSISPALATICPGSNTTVELSATATGGVPPFIYSWSTGSNTSITTVNATGTYSVMVADSLTGCPPATASITVGTGSPPPAPAAWSNSPVCAGDSLKLFADSIPGAIYSWTGPGNFSSGQRNPVLPLAQISQSGDYTVYYSVSGCQSYSATVTIQIKPSPILPQVSSNSPLCQGGNLNLSAASSTSATYSWTGPAGFFSAEQNPVISNVGIIYNGIYAVVAQLGGCSSDTAFLSVIVNTPQSVTAANNGPLCEGQDLQLSCSAVTGATYNWSGPGGFSSLLQSPVINNINIVQAGEYSVVVTIPGCASSSANTTVVVKSTPVTPLASNSGPVCEGENLAFSATAEANVSYQWTGPSSFVSGLPDPVIISAGMMNNGMYQVTVSRDGCTSAPALTTVIVHPIPQAPQLSFDSPVCEGQNIQLYSAFADGASYEWNGPGGFISFIQNPLINNASGIHQGYYYARVTINGCTGDYDSTFVIVNPIPVTPVIIGNSPLCEGSSFNLSAPFIQGAGYLWTGPAGFTSSLENPVISNVSSIHEGDYSLQIIINGCLSLNSAPVQLLVKPRPSALVLSSNSMLCEGSDIILQATSSPGSVIQWSGPNGFMSQESSPVISNALPGYSGYYKASVFLNGCAGNTDSILVTVQPKPEVFAGDDQVVCANKKVELNGQVSGGSSTGIWTSSGSGSFTPSALLLNSNYVFSAADIATGNVRITLSSADNGACIAAQKSFLVVITPAPIVYAGPDRVVCAKQPSFPVSGQVNIASGGIWTSSGTGSFSPSPDSLQAVYIPSQADKVNGSVVLRLTSTGNGTCLPVNDEVIITISPGPLVNAGPDLFVMEGNSKELQASGNASIYMWSPSDFLNDPSLLNPISTPTTDIQYTLEGKDQNGCSNSDFVWVKILKNIIIPNVFTPNGDGINDLWEIKGLSDYPGSSIKIYNRYGQVVFESKGYGRPWDGMFKGNSLPSGTYYYIIQPGSGLKQLSGFVDVVR